MAMEPGNWNDQGPLRVPSARRGKGRQDKRNDIYLCVTFFVLLAWALAVGLGVVK